MSDTMKHREKIYSGEAFDLYRGDADIDGSCNLCFGSYQARKEGREPPPVYILVQKPRGGGWGYGHEIRCCEDCRKLVGTQLKQIGSLLYRGPEERTET